MTQSLPVQQWLLAMQVLVAMQGWKFGSHAHEPFTQCEPIIEQFMSLQQFPVGMQRVPQGLNPALQTHEPAGQVPASTPQSVSAQQPASLVLHMPRQTVGAVEGQLHECIGSQICPVAAVHSLFMQHELSAMQVLPQSF